MITVTVMSHLSTDHEAVVNGVAHSLGYIPTVSYISHVSVTYEPLHS